MCTSGGPHYLLLSRDRDLLRAGIVVLTGLCPPGVQDLVDENTFISEESVQLMKHHGSYMQDDRDKRSLGQGKFYQFMMRTRQPGGHVSNQLYLTMDDLADQVIADNCALE